MGNLQIDSSYRNSNSRKPIFSQQNSIYHEGLSRSLSPYRQRTPKNNMQKSSITNNLTHRQNNSRTIKNNNNNRIYLDSRLIKSVIKDYNDTSYENVPRPNTTRMKKSFIKFNNEQCNCQHGNTHVCDVMMKNSCIVGTNRDRVVVEKKFQETSPRVVKELNNSFNYSRNMNYNHLNIEQQREIIDKNMKDYTISSVNKQNLSLSKLMKSGNSSARTYGIDGHILPQNNHCCCHYHQCNMHAYPNLDKKFQKVDITPTKNMIQRKKLTKYEDQQLFQKSTQQQTANKTNNESTVNLSKNTNTKIKQKNTGYQAFHQQNRQKCQQIMKRVRNFNQFLNEIKNKLRKQSQILCNSSNIQNSISQSYQRSNNQGNGMNSTNSEKSSIRLALKLQNEKIQLQKYRKLVERQLSKQHSIQSISIQSKNKQKIIIINLQQKNANQSQAQPVKKQLTKPNKKAQDILNPDSCSYSQNNQKTKRMLKDKQKMSQRTSKNYKQKVNAEQISKRLNKIDRLFNKMQEINKIQAQQYGEINRIIQDEEQV